MKRISRYLRQCRNMLSFSHQSSNILALIGEVMGSRDAVKQMEKDMRMGDGSLLEVVMAFDIFPQFTSEETSSLWYEGFASWHLCHEQKRITLGEFLARLKASHMWLSLPEWAQPGIDQEAVE